MKGTYSERLDFLPASLEVSGNDFKINFYDFCCATIAEVNNAIKDLQQAKIRGKQLLEILSNI